jgi:acetylornithine deacetylase/succinyl-diaminopimelate desuccinylase-like protein
MNTSVNTREQLVPILECLDDGLDDALGRLFDLLRIPSISTDPHYRDQTAEAARWLADDLASIGFNTEVCPTGGHPMVLAEHPGPGPGAPHVLYYGHYDVQPPDPRELWHSDPFEPVLVDGEHGKRIVGRGAVDDKGQLMTFVEAFRVWQTVHGTLPIRVTVLLEGEEESGSASLEPFLRENHKRLHADVCVVCDTGMWDIDTPAITSMLRGMVYLEATLEGPSSDLHSGMYGGAVVNPLNALTSILGQLHDERGVVQVPGFYEDVREPPETEARRWADLPFDEKAFLGSVGLATPVGESGRTTLERIWSRPTCDLNGVWGGYTGAGAKTVIPARVSAKLSCRLVPDQDPRAIHDALVAFFQQRTPPDCHWQFTSHGASAAISVPTESSYLEAAAAGLEDVYGVRPVLIGCGGSIPVVGSIRSILGFDSLLVGFSLDDDRIHAPNEKFELRCFQQGMRAHTAIMARLAAVDPSRESASQTPG